MGWWVVFKEITSTAGSTLFIGVVLVQGRMYGWRTWLEYGLGTGKPVHHRDGKCEECPVRSVCKRE